MITTSKNRLVLRVSMVASMLMLTLLIGSTAVPTLGCTGPSDPTVTVTNKDQVYYPATVKKDAKFKKPATLLTSTVFSSISEWKEIEKKKLTESDAEYHLLLAAANKKFSKAVKKVQKDGKYDIIAESGAITCKGCTADDVTQKAVDALPKD